MTKKSARPRVTAEQLSASPQHRWSITGSSSNKGTAVMGKLRVWLGAGAFALTVVGLSGCGQASPIANTGKWSCDNGIESVVELLRNGIPTYDYEPLNGLGELIDMTDIVVSGTLLSAERTPVDFGDGDDDGAMTRLTPGEGQILNAGGGSYRDPFSYISVSAERSQTDPLTPAVQFDPTRLRFVAFLTEGPPDQTMSPHLQGLFVACGNDRPAKAVFDPIPGSTGMTIDEVAGAVLAITQPERPAAQVTSLPYRLLAEDLDYGEPGTTRLLNADDVGAVAPDAELDADSEVFFEFNLPESGTCPYGRLVDMEFNVETDRLYPVVSEPDSEGDCTGDATPHVIIVAMSRIDLPNDGFSLWVNGSDPADAAGDAVTFFERGELRAPDGLALEHPVLVEGEPLPLGQTAMVLNVTTHCGFERLWHEIDGRQWVLETPAGGVPSSWNEATRGQDIDFIVERVAADRLVVTARRTTDSVAYVPADDLLDCV